MYSNYFRLLIYFIIIFKGYNVIIFIMNKKTTLEGHVEEIRYIQEYVNYSWVILRIKIRNNWYSIKGNASFTPIENDYIIASGDLNNNDLIVDKNSKIEIDFPKDSSKIRERIHSITNYNLFTSTEMNLLLTNSTNIWKDIVNKTINVNIDNNKINTFYKLFDDFQKKRYDVNEYNFIKFLDLNNIKLNKNQIQNILYKYENAHVAIDKIKNDLINLIDVDTIGFKTILHIAQALNLPFDKQIEILIIVILNNTENGDTCLKIDDIINNLITLLKKKDSTLTIPDDIIPSNYINETIKKMINDKKIIEYKKYLYYTEIFKQEQNIANNLFEINMEEPDMEDYKEDFLENNTNLNEKQLEGCLSVFDNCTSIIIGPAGTGKSHIIKSLTNYFNNYNNIKSLILAPTGKACDRLNKDFKNEKTSYTIHKFIHYDYDKDKDLEQEIYEFEIINKCEIKIFIIDEMSMVDLKTFSSFINKISHLENVKIILLGDTNQLPSVSCGDVLNQLIKSKKFKVTKLTEIKRSDAPNLLSAQNNLLNNYYPSRNLIENDTSFEWIKIDPSNSSDILISYFKQFNELPLILTSMNRLKEKYENIIKNHYNPKPKINLDEYYEKFKNQVTNNEKISNKIIKIIDSIKNDFEDYKLLINNIKDVEAYFEEENIDLTYLKTIKQILKLDNIVDGIQSIRLNKSITLCINDRIIINSNNYKLELMNGMIGTIKKIINNDGIIKIDILFDGYDEIKTYSKDDLTNIDLAYILTIHKSQGSESDNVIILLNKSSKMNNINLLYTAITRAKKKCVLIAERQTVKELLEKGFITRKSKLKDLLNGL